MIGLLAAHIVVLVSIIIELSCGEWVEIPQAGEKKNYKVGGAFGALSFSDALATSSLRPVGGNNISQPNQAWLNYQMERFGNMNPINQSAVINNVNKLIVTDTDRMGNAENSEMYQDYEIPFLTHSTSSSHTDGYDIDINIKTKPSSGRTKLINHVNKLEVTAFKDDYNEDDQETAENSKKTSTTITPPKQPSETEISSFQKFLDYLKSFQNNFVVKTSKGIQEKIQYLHRLKDHLLFEIEDRIKALWPAEVQEMEVQPRKSKRSKRGVLDDSFTSFPSNDGALMTISFLTFAVFLIKLVLLVINTIKSKHYAYNGFSVNTMEGLKLGKSRKSRSYGNVSDNEDFPLNANINAEYILKSIHDFEGKINSNL